MRKTRNKNTYKNGSTKNGNKKRISLRKKGHKKYMNYHYTKGKYRTSRPRIGGGGCGCGKKMKGGMVSSPAAGPVGFSWEGGDVSSWPGVSASQGLDTKGVTMSNHFKLSPNGVVVGGINTPESTTDEQLIRNFNMNGGKRGKNRKSRKKQKGGFFQELVNLGRGATYGIQGIGYGMMGKTQPISQNPYPTESQPIDKEGTFIGTTPPNVRNMFIDANNSVSKI